MYERTTSVDKRSGEDLIADRFSKFICRRGDNVARMMLIRVPLQSVAAVAAAVPPSPSHAAAHRMIAYIDGDTVDKTCSSASSIKVGSSVPIAVRCVCSIMKLVSPTLGHSSSPYKVNELANVLNTDWSFLKDVC